MGNTTEVRNKVKGEHILIDIDWVERVTETEKKHRSACIADPTTTIKDTARNLSRSYGSVNEDLQLASFIRSYPKMCDIRRLKDALIFMRDKKKEIKGRMD